MSKDKKPHAAAFPPVTIYVSDVSEMLPQDEEAAGGGVVVVDGDESCGGGGARKLSIDYLLEGESVKTNSYLRAFAASGLPSVLKSDPHFFSWANIKGKVLRKEVAEASAAAARVPAAITKARGLGCRGVGGESGGGGRSIGGGGSPTTSCGAASDAPPEVVVRDEGERDGLGDGEGIVFFDLCSGKGFTSILLAHRYPKARVLMFDKNEKMNLRHLESRHLVRRVTFHPADLYDDDTAAVVRDAVALHGAKGSAIVGVHLCGDLARRAIELWDTCGVDALVRNGRERGQ